MSADPIPRDVAEIVAWALFWMDHPDREEEAKAGIRRAGWYFMVRSGLETPPPPPDVCCHRHDDAAG